MLPPVIQRTGDRRELLTGPALYGLTHVLATLVFWRGSPAGAAGLAVLCAGDGLAEVIGKRFGGTYRLHNGKVSRSEGGTGSLLQLDPLARAVLQPGVLQTHTCLVLLCRVQWEAWHVLLGVVWLPTSLHNTSKAAASTPMTYQPQSCCSIPPSVLLVVVEPKLHAL